MKWKRVINANNGNDDQITYVWNELHKNHIIPCIYIWLRALPCVVIVDDLTKNIKRSFLIFVTHHFYLFLFSFWFFFFHNSFFFISHTSLRNLFGWFHSLPVTCRLIFILKNDCLSTTQNQKKNWAGFFITII